MTHGAKCHTIPHGLEQLSCGVPGQSALSHQPAQCSGYVQQTLFAGSSPQCFSHHVHCGSRGDASVQQIAHDHERHGGPCARFPPDRR